MKVKTYVMEVPAERFVIKIKGIEIAISDIDDLDLLIEKYNVEEIESTPDTDAGGNDD